MDSVNYARQNFDRELAELEHELLAMASGVERMMADASNALIKLDPALAHEAILQDDAIDQMELAIEAKCMKIIGLQNPAGNDLRQVGACLKIITDLERCADLAVDLAKAALKIDNEQGRSDIIDLGKFATLCRKMIHEALEAYVRRDLDRVQEVADMENQADGLYRELRAQVFLLMRRDPDFVVAHGWLFLAIHHLERIADHSVNIAERVHYMVTGELKQIAGFEDGP
ncbi:MAG: phosphate signaling complex protein PhoU [Armatimonadetes bacterium]|nr:phosphate signaling complex protein PhoU [Armatimonadota bacterium]MBS1725858.1 phosphate signaling complex protein PhoU [Armatimonadota bacterium]